MRNNWTIPVDDDEWQVLTGELKAALETPFTSKSREHTKPHHARSYFLEAMALTIAGGRTPLACFIRDRWGAILSEQDWQHLAGFLRSAACVGAAFTLMFCLAWPRPFVVGAALMAVAMLLEGLQALTPDRSSDLEAAFYAAGGVLAAALLAELFIRARRRANR